MYICESIHGQLLPPHPLLSLPWPHNTTLGAADNPYVHPFSDSFLTTKSLEMCTESGTGIHDLTTEALVQTPQPHTHVAKPINSAAQSSFPPPLTSISGSRVVRVQTHREGGRLIIKAFTVSSCRFLAERGNGRLRLSLLIDCGGDEKEEGVDRENVDGSHISSSRCNGDMSSIKRLQSLPFCVAGIS